MLVGGRRVVPWILHQVARTGSRELFTLAVLAIALGIAYGSAHLFDVSFALGAFFAGVVLAETDLSHQAAENSLPLQDAFAVLVLRLGRHAVRSVRRAGAAAGTARRAVRRSSSASRSRRSRSCSLFGYPVRTALTISASLAQIGEFSFILAGLGVGLGLLPPEGTRPDPGRRAAVDHVQSVRVRHDRADDALARSASARACIARTRAIGVTRRRRQARRPPACAITR